MEKTELTIETVEQGVKYAVKGVKSVKVEYDANGVVLVFLLLAFNIFHTLL